MKMGRCCKAPQILTSAAGNLSICQEGFHSVYLYSLFQPSDHDPSLRYLDVLGYRQGIYEPYKERPYESLILTLTTTMLL